MYSDKMKVDGMNTVSKWNVNVLNTSFESMAKTFLVECRNAMSEINTSTRLGRDLMAEFVPAYEDALESLREERYDDLRVDLEYLGIILFGCDDEYDESEFENDIVFMINVGSVSIRDAIQRYIDDTERRISELTDHRDVFSVEVCDVACYIDGLLQDYDENKLWRVMKRMTTIHEWSWNGTKVPGSWE